MLDKKSVRIIIEHINQVTLCNRLRRRYYKLFLPSVLSIRGF